MTLRTLPIDSQILELSEEMFHTSSLLASYPFLSEQQTQLETLYPEWESLFREEQALVRSLSVAQALVIVADDGIDFLGNAISATILAETNGDRKSVAYQRYFGNQRPSELRRPVLGRQLAVMRSWVPSLKASEHSPMLQEYGEKLEVKVAEGEAATDALEEVERQRVDFNVGPRKRFVDKLNATRKLIHGQIADLAHRSPELNLSRDFPSRFFLRGRSNRRPTLGELERKVLSARERLRRYEEQLQRVLDEEDRADSVRREAARKVTEATMEDLLRQQAELAQQQAVLAEQLETLSEAGPE